MRSLQHRWSLLLYVFSLMSTQRTLHLIIFERPLRLLQQVIQLIVAEGNKIARRPLYFSWQ